MSYYSFNKGSFKKTSEKYFNSESQIQELIEKNIDLLYHLQYVRSEFQLHGLRVDTLAFDQLTQSFVIIEYKLNKNFSVIDQGFSYLALLLNNKADFILEYNERNNSYIKKDSVDWSQSKVIFISPSFTTYQKQSTNFKDLPMELWEIKQFQDNSISLNELIPTQSAESIKTVSKKNSSFEKVTKEVKKITEDDHLNRIPEKIITLYEKLKKTVLDLGGDISIRPKTIYIGFIRSSNFLDVILQKSKIILVLNLKKGTLIDPQKLSRDVSHIGHWGNGDYEIHLSSDKKLDYVISLIKQAYQKSI